LSKTTRNKITQQENKPIATIGLFSLFALVFTISPYFRGLFFSENYYWVGLMIQLLFLGTMIVNFNGCKEMLVSQWRATIPLFFIPLFYSIAYLYSASPYYAANETLQWFSYAIVFVMLVMWMIQQSFIKEGVWVLCWVTLAWIVGLVFLADLGKLEFQDAILARRFSSVFQYPNTLASIVSAFVIAGLMGISKKVHVTYQILYGLTLVPFMLTFLLTESRGGLLVFVLGWGIGLVFLAWKEQILYLLYTGLLISTSFWGFSSYKELIIEKYYFKSALLVLSLSVLFSIVVLAIQFVINRKFDLYAKSRLSMIFPVSIVIAAILAIIGIGTNARDKVISLFPEPLQPRINSINLEQSSVQERILFYKDSLVVWKEYFWFGAGGGGWRALFENYKSLPYFSTQAHSFYMQTLVEVGIVGSLFVFGFFVYALLKGILTYVHLEEDTKSKHNLLAPALVAVFILLLHNAVDFNMSFGTYNLFLFVLLAIIWSYTGNSNEDIKIKLPSISYKNKNMIINIAIALIILASLFSVYKSYAYAQAESLYKQVQQGGNFNELMQKTDKMISFNANDPKLKEYKIQLMNVYNQQQNSNQYTDDIDVEYQTLLKLEPANFIHPIRYSEFLWNNNRPEDALAHLSKALELAPWVQMVYEENVKYRLEYALMLAKENGAQEDIEMQEKELTRILIQLEEKLAVQQGDLPEGLRLTNPIRITNDNRLLFGRAYYYTRDFDKSLEYLTKIDLNKLPNDNAKLNALIYQVLIFHHSDQQKKLQELLKTELAKKLNLEEIHIVLLDDPQWLPLTE
jgi:tetratricopeptide (TPR) repeat protein